MELINIFGEHSDFETLLQVLSIVAIAVLVILLFALVDCWVCSKKQTIITCIITTICIALIVTSSIYCFNTPNRIIYKYYVTDTEQVNTLIDDGWTLRSSCDNIYTFYKDDNNDKS